MKPLLTTLVFAFALAGSAACIAPVAMAGELEPVKPTRPPPKPPNQGHEQPDETKPTAKPKTAAQKQAESEMEQDTKGFKKLPKATLSRSQANDFQFQKRAAAQDKKAAERELKDAKAELVKDYVAAEKLKKVRDESRADLDDLKKTLDTAKAALSPSEESAKIIDRLQLRYDAAKILHDTGPGAASNAANKKLAATTERFQKAEKSLDDAHAEIGAVQQRRLTTQRANYIANKQAKQAIYGPMPEFGELARQNIYGPAPSKKPGETEAAGDPQDGSGADNAAVPAGQIYGQMFPHGNVYDRVPPISEYGPAPPPAQ